MRKTDTLTKEERLANMDWERPDWEFLYHCLLYEVKEANFLDKRTHKQAHEEIVQEARFLRRASDELFLRVSDTTGSKEALDLIGTLWKCTQEA